jgi:hypothetical protein
MSSRVTARREAQSPDLAHLDALELRTMVDRLRSENTSLADLSSFLQQQTEREKAALARELHDSLGGLLTPAKMDLAWLEARLGSDPQYAPRLKRLSNLIDEGIDLKRASSRRCARRSSTTSASPRRSPGTWKTPAARRVWTAASRSATRSALASDLEIPSTGWRRRWC